MVCSRSLAPKDPILTDAIQDKKFAPEVSVVMPCLNEADTLAVCIGKALKALKDSNISGEVIVADNGSVDESPTIAREMGARVIHVDAKGYGNALMGGISAARGKYVIMGDADDSYDFLEIPRFVEKLRQGYDLVQGCRLPRGGGTGDARRDAIFASLVGQSDVFSHGADLVRCEVNP